MICVGFPYARARVRRSVVSLLRTPAATAATRVVAVGRAREFFLSDRLGTRSIGSGGSPMTDVAFLCHNCGSVHEVESIRENLILDLRTAASYEPSGRGGVRGSRARLLRWRMTMGLARALWPGYPHRRAVAWGRQPVQGRPAPVPDRLGPYRAAAGAGDARAGDPALAGTGGWLTGTRCAGVFAAQGHPGLGKQPGDHPAGQAG
jgi:hypothetical protein